MSAVTRLWLVTFTVSVNLKTLLAQGMRDEVFTHTFANNQTSKPRCSMNKYNKVLMFGKACRRQVAFASALALLPTMAAVAVEHDLSPSGSQSVNVLGDVGGTAIFADNWSQPTGTGVFDPFLTLDANGQTSTGNNKIESAYNSDAAGAQQPELYLDQHRPAWNTLLQVSDLATITINNVDYFAFILDANEPGGGVNSLISIDNIRIYTSATDNTANVADDITKLNDLGTLRFAMNDPLSTGSSPPDLNGFNVDQWVKLDAAQENVSHGNANGGSGQGDMVVYIPQSAFGNSLGTDDYVWFYNLNGVHYSVDRGTGATSGFEEWRAVVGPQQVPDGGNMLVLLGGALTALGFLRHKIST